MQLHESSHNCTVIWNFIQNIKIVILLIKLSILNSAMGGGSGAFWGLRASIFMVFPFEKLIYVV